MSQPIRTFLGWDRPLLHLLRDYLLARHAARSDAADAGKGGRGKDGKRGGAGVIDLSGCVVMLPGARAGRRLIELLVTTPGPIGPGDSPGSIGSNGNGKVPRRTSGRADDQWHTQACAALLPPRVTTAEGIWRILRTDHGPMEAIATPLESRLAWMGSLRRTPADELSDLVRWPPATGEVTRWLALADLLDHARLELAAAGKTFAHMPEIVRPLADDAEARRWEAAARAEVVFLTALRGSSLQDEATARAEVITRARVSPPPRVIIAGMVDLNADVRRLAGALADRCEVVVFAPSECAAGFDSHGAVVPAWWASRRLRTPESSMRVVHEYAEQSRAALREIASLANGCAADQVTIGVPDPGVAQSLLLLATEQQELVAIAEENGAGPAGEHAPTPPGAPRLRLAGGRVLQSTPPGVFLAALREFVASNEFDRFAALARHADVSEYIGRRLAPAAPESDPHAPITSRDGTGAAEWLSVLDAYHAEHVHWLVDGRWHTSDSDQQRVLAAVHDSVMHLLAPLAAVGQSSPRAENFASLAPLVDWCGALRDAMTTLYTQDATAGRTRDLQAADAMIDAIDLLRDAAARVAADVACDATQALDLVLRLLADQTLPADAAEPAIDLLGWLELAMDDAPVMVVAGMNEGVVPTPAGAEPLLPNSLRARLGLATRESRYARDAWITSVLTHSRPATVFICSRRGPRHEPRLPSRLLLADDAATVARRIRDWTADAPDIPDAHAAPVQFSAGTVAPGRHTVPPTPARLSAVSSLRVTAFRDYLSSPYVFYLRHILGLEERDPSPLELDAMHFGTLVHDVLSRLAGSDAAHSTDPDHVANFLYATLKATASQRFGDDPMPAVWLQVEQARARLAKFAEWQADWAAQGWRVTHTEWSPADSGRDIGASLMVDGVPMGLRGRIDRIDVNVHTRDAVILDYKTADRPPDESQLRKKRSGEWLDLQLPLYRYLAAPLSLPPDTRLGYVVIPRDPGEIGARLFDWDAAALRSADEAAADVVRRVRRGEFDDLGPRPPSDGILARICGTAYATDEQEGDE